MWWKIIIQFAAAFFQVLIQEWKKGRVTRYMRQPKSLMDDIKAKADARMRADRDRDK